MSLFLEQLFEAEGKTAADLSKLFDNRRLRALRVADLYSLGQVLYLDPIDEFPGHVVAYDSQGKRPRSTQVKMVDRSQWVELG